MVDLDKGFAIVKIYTSKHAIVGKILVTEKEFRKGRLSDYLNRQDIDFIPINDAHVFNLESGRPIASRIFVLLNKRHINWVHPMREPHLEIRGGHEDILLDQDAAEL